MLTAESAEITEKIEKQYFKELKNKTLRTLCSRRLEYIRLFNL